MNDRVSTLVRSILKKDSLNDCSIEELQKLAVEYPYFTPAQFLLVQKLKEINPELYREEVQKLSLHFQNPLWLKHILEQEKIEMLTEEKSIQEEINIPEKEIQIDEPVKKQEADDLSFEPFHTVDYFASQGIKPVQEEKPTDRFGQQL